MLQNMLVPSSLPSRTSWYVLIVAKLEIHLKYMVELVAYVYRRARLFTSYLFFLWQDISLGVALGSATQISMFVVSSEKSLCHTIGVLIRISKILIICKLV